MSVLYRFPAAYEFCMRLGYGRGFRERYSAVDALIPDGAEVLDICAGDCYIYRHYLKKRTVRYSALDESAHFEGLARREGIDFRRMNIEMPVSFPQSDYVLMMASLYQFYPHHLDLLTALTAAAKRKLIITEPVRNLSASPNPLLKAAGRILTHPHAHRFSENDMVEIFEEFGFRWNRIANGREILGVLDRP